MHKFEKRGTYYVIILEILEGFVEHQATNSGLENRLESIGFFFNSKNEIKFTIYQIIISKIPKPIILRSLNMRLKNRDLTTLV